MKEIKLIKVGEHYNLYHRIAEENLIIGFASTDNTFVNKLSLKNCQEIENGYDLYELAEKFIEQHKFASSHIADPTSFKAGCNAILEILGDKKFSEEDVMLGWDAGVMSKSIVLSMEQLEPHRESYQRNLKPASLQQTQYDCEIVMDVCGNNVYAVPEPILDADGCLILKRKI